MQSLRIAVYHNDTLINGRDAQQRSYPTINWHVLRMFNKYITSATQNQGGLAMFPQLRALSCHFSRDDGLTLGCVLQIALRTSSLNSIHFSRQSTEGIRSFDSGPMLPVQHVYNEISRNCTTLREVHIQYESDTSAVTIPVFSTLSSPAVGMQQLRYIDINSALVQGNLEALASLSHLVHLEITVTASLAEAIPMCNPSMFTSLRQLTLDVDSLSLSATLLTNVFRNCQLFQLKIFAPIWEAELNLESCFQAVAQIPSIQDIRFGLQEPLNGGGLGRPPDRNVIRALFSLRDVHTFHWYPWESRGRSPASIIDLVLTADTIEAMARAWLQLRSLRFETSQYSYRTDTIRMSFGHPLATRFSLLHLIQSRFPHLMDLTLSLDETDMPSDLERLREVELSDRPLQFLSVGIPYPLIPQHSRAVVEMIHILFPNLQLLHSSVSSDWLEVKAAFQSIRDGGGELQEEETSDATTGKRGSRLLSRITRGIKAVERFSTLPRR